MIYCMDKQILLIRELTLRCDTMTSQSPQRVHTPAVDRSTTESWKVTCGTTESGMGDLWLGGPIPDLRRDSLRYA